MTQKLLSTAVNADAALEGLKAFMGDELGRKYSTVNKVVQASWEHCTLFLASPAELRRVIYTTNAI